MCIRDSLKANHSVVKRLILDSLRYWVSEMHVDGFRFDLASIFSRNESGEPMLNPPIVWEIDSDPVLAGTKLIAEAWDSGGLDVYKRQPISAPIFSCTIPRGWCDCYRILDALFS